MQPIDEARSGVSDADACTLCDLPTPEPPITDEEVPGTYCCRGCLEVSRTLDDPASADADAAAEALGAGSEAGGGTSSGDVDRDEDEIDGETAYLSVSGMHCATCEAFLESRATSADGVAAAAASYPTETLKVTYDPEAVERDALPGVVDALGYEASHRELDDDRDDQADVGRLLVGGFFGMMTMLWYVLFLYPVYVGVPADSLLVDLTGSAGTYLLVNVWLMATVVLGYTGYPLFRGAYVSLRAGHPNMDLLVAIAAAAAYTYSSAVALTGGTDVYFDVAIVVVMAVTIGNFYEDRTKRRAAGRLADLTTERVDEARRRIGAERRSNGATASTAETETVGVDALEPGDELVVKPGERVPIDGPIVEGDGILDESLVTGESRPVNKTAGDEAIGGSVLRDGRLVVRVEADAQSTLDRVVEVLWDVQSARPGAQRIADRIAAVFVPLVFVLAAVAGAVHLGLGAGFEGALLIALSVLVVSCPCALGLATPLAVARGVRESLADGVVVTDVSTFEAAHEADVVAFDKTGTLTTAEMQVHEVASSDDVEEATLLSRAAALEQYADHPVAAAIVEAADGPVDTVDQFERVPGSGVGGMIVATPDGGARAATGEPGTTDEATVGIEVLVGRLGLFEERGWSIPDAFADRAESARAAGNVPVLVGWNGRVEGVIVAGDEPRTEWERVVEDLAAERRVVVLTGDDASTERFDEHAGVDEVYAGLPPEGKTEVVRRLQAQETVAMVGDGVNDAPALAAADVAIALDHTALAADAAGAVVTTDDLRAVPRIFERTRATNGRIKQNLGWAFLYNAIALPLAVAGLLNPLFAAVAMASSSLLVVANSSRALVETSSRTLPENDRDGEHAGHDVEWDGKHGERDDSSGELMEPDREPEPEVQSE
ncbi:cation-transporting ATPase [Salinarchaeum sp. Harcht-Bsk1]|uniref:heavy metal translocating P-type ATPase n=1 Tax=Salinarchaeum sp. Harcht-Bsk1 TaxID=1333523 RepID=UPI0003423C9D|nr:cation-translocating P-type ATPase [Salinarchaeum sp. Harcht-Bsk1]AGN00673.1 cation-transporting ATPase [Salinarchaeum sp. Harcht-Bsk1]